MASSPIVQFYAELCDYEPKIWRRFQVMDHITMARLGYVLMTLFEMQASHLFCFDVPTLENDLHRREREGHCIDPELLRLFRSDPRLVHLRVELSCEEDADFFEGSLMDAATTKLRSVSGGEGATMTFSYDYGDGWEITLLVERIFEDPALSGRELPRVLEGAGYGIIEDCGGPGGLEELAKAYRRKRGKRYEELREWLGVDALDISAFDLDDMNFRLKKVPRIYADLYEHDMAPTKQSLDLLTRSYKK